MVELVVLSADKQGKDFTLVQGPRVEVTPLPPACLLLIRVYMLFTRGSRRDADLARVLVVLKVCVLNWRPSQPLYNRLGLGIS